MQKPQMKGKGAKGYGKYIMFSANESRADEMDEFGDFKNTDGIHYDGVIDPRFDPDEVVAWLERPGGNDPDKTTFSGGPPDLKEIAENAAPGTAGALVTVFNKGGEDNLLVMLAKDFLGQFDATDRFEVAGLPLNPRWGSRYCELLKRFEGLVFVSGDGKKKFPGFRVTVRNWVDLAGIRREIQVAARWERAEGHTVEYIGGDNNE